MGLWDRSSSFAVIAAMGTVILAGCSSSPQATATIAPPAPVTQAVAPKPNPASAVTAMSAQARASVYSGATAIHDLRVMSFNCRVSTLFDLHNTWGLRKGLLVETIRNFGPDLLGTQECKAAQSDYLSEQLDGYGFFGAGRNDGKRKGEMCGVFFKTSKFEKLDGGHFWLSETPSDPGSKGWGAMFPRMVTWVKLRQRDGGPTFVWFNTHLDAFSSKARLNGARLLRNRMASIARGLPVVVTGDFNADAGSDPYRTLVASTGATGAALGIVDTFRAVYPKGMDKDGTRHAFRGGRGGPRIDWILASGSAFRTVDADIDHTRSGLSYPSDHFPVTAVLRPVEAPTLARIE